MSKFDRCIFISIAIGIWALAMTQVFKPSSAVAVDNSCGSLENPCKVALVQPERISTSFRWILSDVNKGTKIWSE